MRRATGGSWRSEAAAWRGAAFAVALILLAAPATAQTPSPLAYWQYSVGEILAPLEGPLPDWRITLGGGMMTQPNFEGARRYQVQPSLVADIRYRDIAFASDGEGIGVNLLHGQTYRAGIALAYDLGRNQHDDPRLQGLGNIDPAAEGKLFAEYAWLPFVFTAALHRAVGGQNGLVGNLGVYVPLPLGEHVILFTGPTLSLADATYMKSYFGISPSQAAATQFRRFTPGGGLKSTGWGTTAVILLGDHWFIDVDTAYERLLGDAASSPIIETKSQLTVGINLGYRF